MSQENQTEDISKVDLSKVPKPVLIKLRDEMKMRQQAEKDIEELKQKFAAFKEAAEKEKSELTAHYEDALNSQKAKNLEYILQVAQWKKDKESEIKNLLSTKDAKIAQNEQTISSAVEEIKHWKDVQASSFQEIIKEKDKLIQQQTEELNRLREKLSIFQPYKYSQEDNNNVADRPRRHTISFQNLTQGSVKRTHKGSSELKAKVDALKLEVGDLVLRLHKLETIVKDGEEAKKLIEKELALKRKQLNDIMKDVAAAQILKNKQKQKQDEVENKLSIVSDASLRSLLLKQVTKLMVTPPTDNQWLVTLIGPVASTSGVYEPQSFLHYCYAKSVSLYPHRPQCEKRDGEPIADRYAVCHYKDHTIFAIADGCGWGELSRTAAKVASTTFLEFMQGTKQEIVNTKIACKYMLRAFLAAHQKIIQGTNEDTIFTVGTSTMLAGMAMQLTKPESEGKWVVVIVSIGDCKCFHFSKKLGMTMDLTIGNRQNISDPRDPGGRLGPHLSKGAPDLRNLSVYTSICDDDDVILLMTDGVHDNLDPQYAGKSPSEFGLLSKDDTWSSVLDEKRATDVKSKWAYSILDPMLQAVYQDDGQISSEGLAKLVDGLLDRALTNTKNSRDFMEKNPDKRLPDDPKLYSGKMDHATAVVFPIGKKSTAQPVRVASTRTISP